MSDGQLSAQPNPALTFQGPFREIRAQIGHNASGQLTLRLGGQEITPGAGQRALSMEGTLATMAQIVAAQLEGQVISWVESPIMMARC